MKYIISVTNKKGIDPFEVDLHNRTEIGTPIEWENEIYTVNKIVITDPESGHINLHCTIKPKNRVKKMTTIWN